MNKYIESILGICFSALLFGGRHGPKAIARASYAATKAAKASARMSDELRTIPIVELEDILGNQKVEIQLSVQCSEDGVLPVDQQMILLSLLAAERPGCVLEIGTFMGQTTKAMALNAPQATIHTIDLPPDYLSTQDPVAHLRKDDYHLITQRKIGREFVGTPLEQRIHQHYGDTAVWDFRQADGATFFFIDGSHTYDYCKSDSEKCYSLCGGRGVFFWHDCDDGHHGVVRFLAEWRARGRNIVRFRQTSLAYWKAT